MDTTGEAVERPIPSEAARLFRAHNSHPVALTMALMDAMGPHWIEWEPETLKAEIYRLADIKTISENNWNKIQAVRTLLCAVSFWNDWGTFEKVIHALNNNVPRFDVVQVCSLPQLMAGVDIAGAIRNDQQFSDEVARYVAACAMDVGVTYLPPPLDFAAEVLAAPQYVCRDCGNEDAADLEDGRCDYCCGRFKDEHPLNMKPSPYVPSTVGNNVERYLLRDPSAAKKRFEELVVLTELPNLDDTSPEDVQAAKLLVAHQYMVERRTQMVAQLKSLEKAT